MKTTTYPPFRTLLNSLLFSGILLVPEIRAENRGADRISLGDCCLVADPLQPSYVQYGVEDLVSYLAFLTGHKVPIVTGAGGKAQVCIAVGPKAAQRYLGKPLPVTGLGEEGFVLKSVFKDDRNFLVVAGSTPHGTKAGLAALMKRIRVKGHTAFLDAPLDVTGKPAFAKRGLHFNGWAFHYPYTFRCWREEDWQHFLDLLAYQGVNLFYLWPFIEIMPVPLSREDQAYLEECRRIVHYAQQKHGMEVWIMQCTNRVAQDRCGVADPRRRPYWRPSQKDLNPGNPEHLQAILKSREALYRIVNNADGVCNIDSDPGYCPGSPLSDYLKVLQGCRNLLDRHNINGKQAQLINWLWMGWGRRPGQTGSLDQHQVSTIHQMKQSLSEPWGLIAGVADFLPLCWKEQVLGKTVFLPYGLIEGEPSYPATNVQIDVLREVLNGPISRHPGLAGVMGNVQTPLLQFPNVFYFTSALWDLEYRKHSEKEVLLDLSGYLYPDHRELCTACFLALKESDPGKIESLAGQLESVVRQNRLGPPGLFGRKLFPDNRIVAQSLVMQLRHRAALERLLGKGEPVRDESTWTQLILDYCEAYLTWDLAHGWHAVWGWGNIPLASDSRFHTAAARLAKTLGNPNRVTARFEQIRKTLVARFNDKAVNEGCIVRLQRAVLSALPIESLAQKARASASVVPDPARYPPSAANDGNRATLYWPGALVTNNAEWLQLTWDTPQTFDKVVVCFLKHPSMPGRTIHLQKEVAPGKWEDFARTVIPNDPATPHATATFNLPARVTLDKIRVVNLLDLFEIEVR